MKVCITTAGKGSRMGAHSALNKALLPVAGKAAISHIIRQFNEVRHFPDTEFVIALGYQGQQVRDYLELAHPDENFTFVEVTHLEGNGSGPGRSLWECRDHLQEPFIYVACDTLFESTGFHRLNPADYSLEFRGGDWLGVAVAPPEEEGDYFNVSFSSLGQGEVTVVAGFPRRGSDCHASFIGLMHVERFHNFWRALEAVEPADGSWEITAAIEHLDAERSYYWEARHISSWRDIGTEAKYRRVISRTGFDFSKPGEAFYRLPGRVLKFFASETKAAQLAERAAHLRGLVPPVERRNNFLTYHYVEGHTLYEKNSPQVFRDLLNWLDDNLWQITAETEVQAQDMVPLCREFYHDKTYDRLAMFKAKHRDWKEPKNVNGTRVYSMDALLPRIDWPDLFRGRPGTIHGDLQFDNIIRAYGTHFMLIDWRENFAGQTDVGDINYDYAKLLGGIRLNYDLIKKGDFTFDETDEGVTIDWAHRGIMPAYEAILRQHIENRVNWKRIETLVGLIYLNMAPLHAAPFDKFLYALAQLTLTRVLA